jgi:hypothetical protein
MIKISNPYLDSRSQFERNFNLLAELLSERRVSFSLNASRSADGLIRIKKSPNGRINLLTIDESARSTANGLQQILTLQKQ